MLIINKTSGKPTPVAEILNAKDLAKLFHRSQVTILRWARRGILPTPTVYRGVKTQFWTNTQIDEWLEKGAPFAIREPSEKPAEPRPTRKNRKARTTKRA